LRPTDDPDYVMIDLDFDSSDEAEAMLVKLRQVWQSPEVAPALAGTPLTRIVETVDSKEL
ncbi:MAG: hypothetical protein H0T78_02655, partial [Longispora sp.]|nr:hypothetical protein [Longispora sp. (in: high G+C Gram-positive bacteria)]